MTDCDMMFTIKPSADLLRTPVVWQQTPNQTPCGLRNSGADTFLPAVSGQTGVGYRGLFDQYIRGADGITIQEPYLSDFFQIKNLVGFLIAIRGIAQQGSTNQVNVSLRTRELRNNTKQLTKIAQEFGQLTEEPFLQIKWIELDDRDAHDRWLATSTGWMIDLGRGLHFLHHPDNASWPSFYLPELQEVSHDFIVTISKLSRLDYDERQEQFTERLLASQQKSS